MRQSDLAEATGIDQRTISNYETEKTYPDSYALLKLSDFFDVSIDYLLGKTQARKHDKQAIIELLDDISTRLSELKNEIDKL